MNDTPQRRVTDGAPKRRLSRNMQALMDIIDRRGRPLETFQMVAVVEFTADRILRIAWFLLAIATIQFVLTVPGGLIVNNNIQHNSKNANQTKDAAREAKAAAQSAGKTAEEIKQILKAALDPSNPNSQASLDAIERIKAIEFRICGGPCPQPPKQTTTTTLPKG